MLQFKTFRYVLLIALLAVAVSPVAAQDDGTVTVPAGEPITLVVATDLTGPIAEFGLDIAQAVEVAVAQVNDTIGDAEQVRQRVGKGESATIPPWSDFSKRSAPWRSGSTR